MRVYELAAIGAAACWAITAMISPMPANHLGATAFNRLRQTLVFVMLGFYVVISGVWRTLPTPAIPLILLSGLIGIFVGDTLLFACMNRLGPRRSSILFALNAPFAAVLGWVVLRETISLQAIIGISVAFVGVSLAIFFGGNRSREAETKGTLAAGCVLGAGAALCHAIGALIMRPIMKSGIDPFAASMLRVGVGAFALTLLLQCPFPSLQAKRPITRQVLIATTLSGAIALALGMSLLLFALSGGEVGVVSTLSATTPVLILPLIWWRTRVRPVLGAWVGAIVTLCGLALIFLRDS